jgi:hypothetical protein
LSAMNSTRIGTLLWAIMMFFLLTCYLATIAGLFGVVGAKIVSFVALVCTEN